MPDRARYRKLFENALEAFFVGTPEGDILEANPAAERLLGMTQAEIRAHRADQLMVGDDAYRQARAERRERGSWEGVLRVRRKDGTTVPVELVSSLFWDEEEGRELTSVSMRDVSRRLEAEAELRRHERAVGESEERLAAIVNAYPGALVLLDLDDRIVFANATSSEAALALTGRAAVGQRLQALFPADSVAQFAGPLAQAKAGEPQRFEVVHRTPEGGSAWERVAYVPLRDPQGRVHRVVAAVDDVTAARRAEQAQRELAGLEAQLAGVAASVPGMVYQFRRSPGAEDSIPFASPVAEEVVGFAPRELVESVAPLYARIHPDDVPGMAASNDESARALRPWHQTFRYDHPRKGPRVLEAWGLPRREAGGSVLWNAFMMDVTEQRAAEAALRETAARAEEREGQLASMARAAIDGYWVADRNGILLEVNEAYCQMSGYSRAELVGAPIAKLEARESAEDVGRHLARVFAEGTSRFESTHRRRDGSLLEVEISTARHGERLVTFIRDITARKRAEEDVARSREELRALTGRLQAAREEEKARIAQDLHDDLGQALTGLQYEMRWLEDQVDALLPEARRAGVLDRLVSASGLAASMLETVQRITRELRPAALDRLGLAAALRQELPRFEQRTGIVVVPRLDADVPLPREVTTALYRICQEALTNVARHAGARQVDVDLAVQQGLVVLRVRDDGRGLDPGAREGRGSLGILGMMERARAIGGAVTVEPGWQGGTVVVATVPLRREEAGR